MPTFLNTATLECDDCVYTECTASCGDYGLVYGERECRRTIGLVKLSLAGYGIVEERNMEYRRTIGLV